MQVTHIFSRRVHAGVVQHVNDLGALLAACADGAFSIVRAQLPLTCLFKMATNPSATLVSAALSPLLGGSLVCGHEHGGIEVWSIYDIEAARLRDVFHEWLLLAHPGGVARSKHRLARGAAGSNGSLSTRAASSTTCTSLVPSSQHAVSPASTQTPIRVAPSGVDAVSARQAQPGAGAAKEKVGEQLQDSFKNAEGYRDRRGASAAGCGSVSLPSTSVPTPLRAIPVQLLVSVVGIDGPCEL